MKTTRILGQTTATPYRAFEIPNQSDGPTPLALTSHELRALVRADDAPPGLLMSVTGGVAHADGCPLTKVHDPDAPERKLLYAPRSAAWKLIPEDPGTLPPLAGTQARDEALRGARAWTRDHNEDHPTEAGLNLWRDALEAPSLDPQALGALAAALTSRSTFSAVLHSLLPFAIESNVRAYALGRWQGPWKPHDPLDEPIFAAVFIADEFYGAPRPDARAHRALPLLSEIIAHTHDQHPAAAPLALWSFVHWWYGNRASAHAAATAALDLDPVHTLAMLMQQQATSDGGIPAWLQD